MTTYTTWKTPRVSIIKSDRGGLDDVARGLIKMGKPHTHTCLICLTRWECRNRRDSPERRERVCWECLVKGVEECDAEAKRHRQDSATPVQ